MRVSVVCIHLFLVDVLRPCVARCWFLKQLGVGIVHLQGSASEQTGAFRFPGWVKRADRLIRGRAK